MHQELQDCKANTKWVHERAGSKFLPFAGGKSREHIFSGSGSHNHLCVQSQELGYLSFRREGVDRRLLGITVHLLTCPYVPCLGPPPPPQTPSLSDGYTSVLPSVSLQAFTHLPILPHSPSPHLHQPQATTPPR